MLILALARHEALLIYRSACQRLKLIPFFHDVFPSDGANVSTVLLVNDD